MYYALGMDVSKWQGVVDFAVAKKAGAFFAYIRAGCGLEKDIYFEDNYRKAKAAGLLVGAYYVPIPTWELASQTTVLLGALAGKTFDLPTWIDIENIRDTYPTNQQVTDCGKHFLRSTPKVNNKPAIVYTRQSYFDYHTLPDAEWALHELSAARYSTVLSSPWSDNKYVFRDWRNWTFWQFSADGNGRGAEFGCSSPDVDLDFFNGDVAALYAYAGKPVPVELTLEGRLSALEAGHNELLAAADQLRGAIEALQNAHASVAATLATRGEQIEKLQAADMAFASSLATVSRLIGNHEQRLRILESGWVKRPDPGIEPLPLEPGPGLPKPKPVAE